MKKITFGIVTKGSNNTIKKCLNSIGRIPYKNKEIIVVIDGFSKQTSVVCEKYTEKVFVKSNEEIGIGSSRNIIFEQAKGDFVFLIDGDIEIEQINVPQIIHFFDKHPRVAALSGKYYSPKSGKFNLNYLLDQRRVLFYHKKNKSYIYNRRNYTTFSGGFSCTYKKRLGTIPLFINDPQRAAEDLVWQYDLIEKGYNFAYYPGMIGRHLHIRHLSVFLRKCLLDARGSLWIAMKALEYPGFPSPIENIFYYPMLFILGSLLFFTSYPLLGAALLLLEFLPHLYLMIFSNKLNLYEKVIFLFYYAVHKLLLSILAIKVFFSTKYTLKTKWKFFLFAFYSDLFAKINWITRIGSMRPS